MKKKLTEILKSVKSDRKQAVFITILLGIYLTYFISRAVQFPSFAVSWLSGILFAFCALSITRFSSVLKKNTKKIVGALTLLYLIYSFFYFRTNSWDGMNLYLRSALLVKQKLHSEVLQGMLFPYLSELFLGLVGRFAGDGVMFLMFGLASVASLYTSYLLYKRLDLSNFVTKSSLLILASSSTYIMLSAYEFKVELFLLFFCNLFLLTIIKTIERLSYRQFIVLGVLASVSLLIKVSVLPLVLFAPIFVVTVLAFRKDLRLVYAVKYLGLFTLAFLIPIYVWTLYTPTKLPIIGDVDLLQRQNDVNFVDLKRDSQLLGECSSQGKQRDLSSWIYYKNKLWIFLQPFQYLFFVGLNKGWFIFNLGNPGPYIYFGIWLLPFVSVIFYRKRDLKKFLVFTSTIPFIVTIYYVAIGVFWYFFPVFPLLATVVPILAERYVKTGHARNVFKIALLSLVITYTFFAFAFAGSLFNINHNLRESNSDIWDLSKVAQNLPGSYYIMDATQHFFLVFLPFMDNYDTRVVRSNYYFVSSGKSIGDMRQEMLNKNIRYIIARKDTLFDSWYQGCPLRNNEILSNFLEKYTRKVYDSGGVGEIYEII